MYNYTLSNSLNIALYFSNCTDISLQVHPLTNFMAAQIFLNPIIIKTSNIWAGTGSDTMFPLRIIYCLLCANNALVQT